MNRVDAWAADYGGNGTWDGALSGCCGDVIAMSIASAKAGFETQQFICDYGGTFTSYGNARPEYTLYGHGTRNAFREVMAEVAASSPGDLWVIWYSGHGSQTKYALTSEEGLCFFDGILTDRELWSLFQQIPQDVRVFFGADCCHAAGMPGTRRIGPFNRVKGIEFSGAGLPQVMPPFWNKGNIAGSLAFWAACGKDQLSLDGKWNGLFTSHVLDALKRGMRWTDWSAEVLAKMPPEQQPELQRYGAGDWSDVVFT